MPRTTTDELFIKYQLRNIAANKKAAPGTRLRAVQLLGHMKGLLPPPSPVRSLDDAVVEAEESLSGNGLDDTVKAMLGRIAKAKIRGGTDGDKLPESGTSGG